MISSSVGGIALAILVLLSQSSVAQSELSRFEGAPQDAAAIKTAYSSAEMVHFRCTTTGTLASAHASKLLDTMMRSALSASGIRVMDNPGPCSLVITCKGEPLSSRATDGIDYYTGATFVANLTISAGAHVVRRTVDGDIQLPAARPGFFPQAIIVNPHRDTKRVPFADAVTKSGFAAIWVKLLCELRQCDPVDLLFAAYASAGGEFGLYEALKNQGPSVGPRLMQTFSTSAYDTRNSIIELLQRLDWRPATSADSAAMLVYGAGLGSEHLPQLRGLGPIGEHVASEAFQASLRSMDEHRSERLAETLFYLGATEAMTEALRSRRPRADKAIMWAARRIAESDDRLQTSSVAEFARSARASRVTTQELDEALIDALSRSSQEDVNVLLIAALDWGLSEDVTLRVLDTLVERRDRRAGDAICNMLSHSSIMVVQRAAEALDLLDNAACAAGVEKAMARVRDASTRERLQKLLDRWPTSDKGRLDSLMWIGGAFVVLALLCVWATRRRS